MARRARRTSWKPGQSGNPRGRPRGVKELLPRGLVQRIVLAVVQQNEQEAAEAFRRMLMNPRTVREALELAARLNKEIGAGLGELGESIVNVYTNVDPMKLRQPGERPADPPPEVPHD